MKRFFMGLVSILLILSLLPINYTINAEDYDVELWNAVKPLETTISFVNVGAHPDDERSDLLAYLSRGHGVQTASLIANRGEGGQNQIGSELFDTLGIIRSLEMKEAAKVNGVEAFHLSETTSDSIYDFGFSKTPEETLNIWGEDVTHERLIRFIRTYRPDIIMPTFRDVDSQHGHHRAMTQLGLKAFEDAADPTVYPEQIQEGLTVWQAKKSYLPAESKDTAEFSVEIGDFDEIYGMTYPQLGEKSRYLHKSQGMGNDIPAEPRETHFEVVQEKGLVVTNNENPIFDGIPTNFTEWSEQVPNEQSSLIESLVQLNNQLVATVTAYPNESDVFLKSGEALMKVRELSIDIENAELDAVLKADLLHKLAVKEVQLQNANFVASKIKIDAEIDSSILTQGQETTINLTITNNGSDNLTDAEFTLSVPADWDVSGGDEVINLAPGEQASLTFNVHVPEDAEYFKPYDIPVVQVASTYNVNDEKVKWVEDLTETIAVLPEIGLTLTPEELVINTENVQEEVAVTIKVKNYSEGTAQAMVGLDVPDGFEYSPSETEVDFSRKFEEKEVTFNVIPPKDIASGDFNIDAKATYKGKELTSTIQEIHYEHIGDSYYEYPAKVNGIAFELNTVEGLKVGYIESGFDEVPDYLSNAGFDITRLEEEDLASGDLSQYDTIVTGIRAYLAREDLVEHNDRLNDYVKNGGHLVVQHNLPAEWDKSNPAPYPIKVGRPSIEWRVTDENAKVNVLKPESPLFNFPNEIVDSDWDNWIQERGLYFPMEWAEEYDALVSMADPNEEPFEGSMLFAEYGEGSYLYTSLGFYRQIQNQVAGGYRIFTNLISYGMEDNEEEALNMTKVSELNDIEVVYGTALEDIDLPTTVAVELSDGSEVELPVSWDNGKPEYNGKTASAYQFTGEIADSDDIRNANSLTASIIVNVLEEVKEPEKEDETENNEEENPDKDNTTPPANGDESNNNNDGASLPKTATTMYSTLLIGLLVLVVGGGVYIWRRKVNSVK